MVLNSADRLCTRRLWRILKSQHLLLLDKIGNNSLRHQLRTRLTNIFMNQNSRLRVPSNLCMAVSIFCRIGGVIGTVDSESGLRSAGTLLLRVQPCHRRPGLTEGLKA
ncbi:hypothetical protein PoB_006597800 [Plakobranchus ocellatus]|uniref:Uncharacterized protein n=1 Tax=Plakobranchus ocellatus TaxID=259542 RepID=A0AAV4D5Z4_9GAST|nr:hypothetical protein PoB_006597800 [Plakobranchus ocellatus]